MNKHNDFKSSIDSEFKESDYVFKKLFVRIIIITFVLTVFVGGIVFA